jgi:RNA polymerase sigma-70 factor (sigma-E family)
MDRAASWSEIYREEKDSLIRLAYLLTGSPQAAEDLVQDCFAKVMGRQGIEGHPGPYLRRSVINACYSWHRRAWREQRRIGPAELELAQVDPAEVEMWDALASLAPRRRAVIVMRYYLDMSEAQIAEALSCRVGTVKSAAHRALRDLRKALER